MQVESEQKQQEYDADMRKFLQQADIPYQAQCIRANRHAKNNIGNDYRLAGIECGGSQHRCTGKDQENGKKDGMVQFDSRLL